MRLLLVTGGFPARSETFIYRKVVALAQRGHAVTVATRKVGDWSLYPDGVPANVRVLPLLPDHSVRDLSRLRTLATGGARFVARDIGGARALLASCRRDPRTRAHPLRHFARHLALRGERPDVVHFEFLAIGAMYPLVRAVIEAPIVVSCRGNDLHTLELRSAEERESALACLRDADAVHCVSSEMAREVTRISGRVHGLHVNRPAVDVERITPRTAAATGPVRLLATGRLVWKKGFDYLLAACAQLARAGVAFHAEIVGEGELHSALAYSIQDLGLGAHVTLTGALSSTEVLARMQATDIFVLSSVEEGISNAVLEAMASSVPIVTTTAGGMAEAVTDGVEGYVVPVRDARQLADRIAALAADPALRRSMGEAARKRAVAEFSLARQVTRFEEIYRTASGALA